MWRILAMVLPLCFILAVIFRPASTKKYDPIKSDFSFALKKLTNSSAQLTVELRNSLKVPSCLLYISSGSKDVLLGMIDRKGSYHFELSGDEETITIRLYDAIHRKVIMQTNVSYNND